MPLRLLVLVCALGLVPGAAPAPDLVIAAGHAGTAHSAVFVGPYLAVATWSHVALVDVTSGLTVARLPQRSLVMSMDASPSGTLLAVGTCGHAINLWDVRTRAIVRTIDLQQECADSVSFSPDGTLLVTDNDTCRPVRGLQVRDVRTGEVVRELDARGAFTFAVFGGNGKWIAAVDDNSQVTLFDWPSGRRLRALAAPVGPMGRDSGLITSRDGRYLAWRGDDIHIWDVATGNETIEPVRVSWPQSPVAFLEDGRFAFVQNQKLIGIALPGGARSARSLPEPPVEVDGDVAVMKQMDWLAIGRDGKSIAGVRESGIVLWEARTGRARRLRSPALVAAESLQWTRGDLVVWEDLGVGGWDARTGSRAADFGDGVIGRAAFSADGVRAAAVGMFGARVFDVSSRRASATREIDTGPDTGIAFAPNGRIAFAADGELTLFDDALRRVRSLAKLDAYASVSRLAFSPDGRWLAAGIGGSTTFLRAYRTDGSTPAATLDTQDVTYGEQPVAFSADSTSLASVVRGTTLTLWTPGSWTVARAWTLAGTGRALAFAPAGTRLAIATDSEAAIWDAETGRPLVMLPQAGAARLRAIAWSPDARRLATAGDDGVLRFWSAEDGRLLASLYVPAAGRDWLLVTPDGRIDGTDRALRDLVAWRTGDRVMTDAAITRRHRTRGLWQSLQ